MLEKNTSKTFDSKTFGKVEVTNQNDEKILVTAHSGSYKSHTYGINLVDLGSANIPQALWNEVMSNL
jgi:hypothetical protein